jgi:hypothetical protein
MPRYKRVHYGLVCRAIRVAVNRWGPKPLRDLVHEAEKATDTTMDATLIKQKLGNMVQSKTELRHDIAVVVDWVYPTVTPRQRM